MRTILIVLVAGTLLAVPLAGSAERATTDIEDAARLLDQTHGMRVTPEELAAWQAAERTIELPAGSLGVQAAMDWERMELRVEPLFAPPVATDVSGESSCFATAAGAINLGWAVSPFSVGNTASGCAPGAHQHAGGMLTHGLLCMNVPSGVCAIDARSLGGLGPAGYLYLYCSYTIGVAATEAPIPSPPVWIPPLAGCFAYYNGFQAPPSNWNAYQSLVAGTLGSLSFGCNNFGGTLVIC